MIKRFLETHLRRLAGKYPVVTMTGPRQSGKTTLCQAVFPKLAYVNLEDLDIRRFAKEDPRGFLARYPDGVILDEIQRAPDLPSYIQGVVDEKKRPGQFILTGSQQFEVLDTIRQSLAGRTALIKLLPLAFGELYSSSTAPSLSEILYDGFYPRIHDQHLNPTEALSFYVATYLERDLQSFIQVRELDAFERFLKICATHVGRLTNYSAIGSDCGIDQKTTKSWLSVLEASYVIYFVRPHFKNFKKRITKSPKLYFSDVGLASYLLGISSPSQLERHPLRGALFENFIATEILKHHFNTIRENPLSFFRDHLGNEVDLVVTSGANLASVEIKSGETVGSDFFKGLEYYAKIAGKENTAQYLVYGGGESRVQKGIHIYSYRDLENFLDHLRKKRL